MLQDFDCTFVWFVLFELVLSAGIGGAFALVLTGVVREPSSVTKIFSMLRTIKIIILITFQVLTVPT